jgi:hypothetical protein
VLTLEIDGGATGLVRCRERNVKVAARRIYPDVAKAGRDNLNRLSAVVEMLAERMFHCLGRGFVRR